MRSAREEASLCLRDESSGEWQATDLIAPPDRKPHCALLIAVIKSYKLRRAGYQLFFFFLGGGEGEKVRSVKLDILTYSQGMYLRWSVCTLYLLACQVKDL